MSSARARSATAELVLAAAFAPARPQRGGSSSAERLRAAAAAPDLDGSAALAALERHGLLCLAHHELRYAGALLPADAAALLAGRDAALRQDAERDPTTLARLVAACRAEGLEPTLLKGASLALDTYAEDPAWRSQGDLDVLVASGEVDAAVRAARAVGLVPGERAFPTWWYRLTHFHLRLEPVDRFLRAVEIHWALHAPALLLDADPRALRARRVPLDLPQGRAWALDRLDRLMHLATHLLSHWHGRPAAPQDADLGALVLDADHPLRLKWVLDLVLELERVAQRGEGAALAQRAREWGACGELRWVVEWLRGQELLGEAASAWARGDLGPLEGAQPAAPPAADAATAVPELGFRLGALRRLPRWIWPPAETLRRRAGARGVEGPGGVAAFRLRHASSVLARVLLAAALLPAAWLGRALQRAPRRRARAAAFDPERVLELVSEHRRRATRPRA